MPVVFCNLAILTFASSIQCSLMTTLIIIICAYIAINLAMLVFKPVRKSWKRWLSWCCSLSDLWTELFSHEVIGEEKWWKRPVILVLFVLVVPAFLLVVVVFTLAPFFVYRNAIDGYKWEIEKTQKEAAKEPPCTIPSPKNWGAMTDLTSVQISLDLPFQPDIHDVFYVENEYDTVVNNFILEHYEELRCKFVNRDLNLVYLPKLSGFVVSPEVLQYMFPYLSPNTSFKNDITAVEKLKQHIISGAVEGPALLHRIRQRTDPEYYYFSYCPLVPDSETTLSDQFEWYVRNTTFAFEGNHARFFHHEGEETDDVADRNFVDDIDPLSTKSNKDLAEEIRERIKELRRRGVQLNMLNEFVEEKPTLSRMVITKDYRIYLPDYNNIEITMSPLPKSVYLLFLKHPEGILFKHLGEYYEELLDIYKEVGSRVIERNVRKSIRDITDPTNNSINEKCARIREAFLKHFDTPYAKNYYITGKRGEPKKIILPRELVDLQAL